MKTKSLILALAIMGSSIFAFSQQTVPEPMRTDCDKKVLNKIKRKLTNSNATALMQEGTKTRLLITCYVNQDKEVELSNLEGGTTEIRQAILATFNKHSIKCPNETIGNSFSFWLTLKKYPA